jgi:hypothetical protein
MCRTLARCGGAPQQQAGDLSEKEICVAEIRAVFAKNAGDRLAMSGSFDWQ